MFYCVTVVVIVAVARVVVRTAPRPHTDSRAVGRHKTDWRIRFLLCTRACARPAVDGGCCGGAGERGLAEWERDRWEDTLRDLTVERPAIRDAMVWALDNADAAAEVADILLESLTLDETPPPAKIARLFLVSDILHNSTAPVRNASRCAL